MYLIEFTQKADSSERLRTISLMPEDFKSHQHNAANWITMQMMQSNAFPV
jgi:hypothetical protein